MIYDVKEPVVDLKDFEREEKKRKVIAWIKAAPEKAWTWINDNWEKLLVIAPGVFYGVKRVIKTLDDKKETYHQECQVYDHSLGMWHDLKKAMTKRQKEEFARRRKAGESVLEILSSMGLLKR